MNSDHSTDHSTRTYRVCIVYTMHTGRIMIEQDERLILNYRIFWGKKSKNFDILEHHPPKFEERVCSLNFDLRTMFSKASLSVKY